MYKWKFHSIWGVVHVLFMLNHLIKNLWFRQKVEVKIYKRLDEKGKKNEFHADDKLVYLSSCTIYSMHS